MVIHWAAAVKNPILLWLFRHGWEPPAEPRGFAADAAPGAPGPAPEPWRVAVGSLVRAAMAMDLASRLPAEQQEAVRRRVDATIATVLDEECGTHPRRGSWPWPWPPPWQIEIVSELTLIANALQPGGLKDAILDIAGRAASRMGAAPG